MNKLLLFKNPCNQKSRFYIERVNKLSIDFSKQPWFSYLKLYKGFLSNNSLTNISNHTSCWKISQGPISKREKISPFESFFIGSWGASFCCLPIFGMEIYSEDWAKVYGCVRPMNRASSILCSQFAKLYFWSHTLKIITVPEVFNWTLPYLTCFDRRMGTISKQ